MFIRSGLKEVCKKIALSELCGLKRQIRSQRMHKGAEFEFGAGFECIQSRFIFLFIEEGGKTLIHPFK